MRAFGTAAGDGDGLRRRENEGKERTMSATKLIGKAAIAAAMAVILGTACYFVASVAARPTEAGTATITPFTLRNAVYFYTGGSPAKLVDLITVARLSDGTRARVASAGPLGFAKNIYTRTISYMDGSRTELLDAARVKSTLPPPQHDASFHSQMVLSPPPNCVYNGETLLQRNAGKVDGQAVVEVQPPPVPGFRSFMWAAPALGCQVLTYRTERKQSDGTYSLASEKRVLSLQIGAPDPRLFDPGHDYAEMQPSDLGHKMFALFGVSPPAELSPSMIREDNTYNTLWGENPDWQGH
jgi:hypothetical protein